MKKVYALTVYDVKLKGLIVTQYYSNLRAANKSFETVKKRLTEQYDLDIDGFKPWVLSDGGASRTDIYEGLYNVSIIKWNVQKDPSTWIK